MASVPSLNGRYHLWRVLSDGPGGRVYVASDSREPASPIVLKSFHGEDLGEGRRFYERLVFRTALRHPNLGAVLDFGRVKEIGAYTGPPPDGDGWENLEAFTPSIPPGLAPDLPSVYLTSPYLGGGNLADVSSRFLASAPSRSELDRWLSGISLQILEALRFLHEHSFLHFDVKPEHVLFDDGVEIVSGIQHATLIDLGLSARESTPLGNRVRGTFPYMAPEVLKNSMVDPRADIYSFGATLYHALTGGVLIESHGREKLQAMVDQGRFPAPADLLPSLPEGWSELILRLLSPDPAARPRNAAELIHEISGRPAAVALAERAQGGITWEPPRLTGLEREFDYVHREIEKLQLGETGSPLILLGGAQGVGRHAVANRLCDLARVEGVEIFRVHCCGPGVPPLAPLGDLLMEIRQHRLTPPELFPTLEGLIHAIRDGRRPPPEEETPLIERQEERIRLFDRLGAIFTSLDPAESHLFVIEDLQRAAPELIEALSIVSHRIHLLHGVEAGREPEYQPLSGQDLHGGDGNTDAHKAPRILFLATIDDQTTPPAELEACARVQCIDALSAQPHVSRVTLKSLTLSRTKEVIREGLGRCHIPPAVLQELHQLSGGRTRALMALLWESRRHRFLCQEQHGWVWQSGDTAPRRLAALRGAEWRDMPEGQRTALQLHEIAGGTLDLAVCLGALEELKVEDPGGVIDSLCSSFWLSRSSWGGGRTCCLLERELPPGSEAGRRQEERLLATLGRIQLRRHPDNPVGGVNLLLRAGAWEELPPIIPRALEALRDLHCDASLVLLVGSLRERAPSAELLSSEWILMEAEALVELGLQKRAVEVLDELPAEPMPPHVRAAALIERGRIHRQEKRFSVARRDLEEALELAMESENKAQRIPALLELGSLHLTAGFPERAHQCAERAMSLLGGEGREEQPEADLAHLAAVQSFLARAHAKEGRNERAARVLEKVLDEQGESLPTPWRSRLHHQLASLEHTRGRYEPALKHWEQSMPIDRRNGNVLGLAAVLGRLGAIHYLRGEREKAAELYRQSLRIWEEINDRGGVARMQNNIGLVYKLQNRLEEAEACFRRCLAILKELGPRDEEAIALGNLSDIMMMTGNFPLALDYSLRGLEIRKPLGNRSGIAFSYYRIGLIYRTQGELDRAADYVQKSLEIRRELDEKNNLSYSLKLLGDLEVTRGRYFEGYRYLRQSLSHCEALGNRAGRCTLLTALATVYRLVGMHEEAVSHAGEAVEIARDDHLDYYVGSALLCQAVNHLELGELSAAEGVLEEAEQIFRSQRSRRELAMVLLEKARLALELGNLERGISILAEAYTTVEELGLLDLYPPYYRLRGAFAASGHGPDLALARKLLERGLEEAQRLDLPDEIWRDHRLLALLEERCGNRESADQHLRLAVEGVRGIGEPLPGQFRASYFDSGEQAELLADWESRGSEGLTPAREEIPEEPPPQPADGGLPAEDLARLQEVVLLLTSERDLQILLDRILDEVLKLFNAERGFLILTDGADHEIRAARNIDREEVERPELKYSRSIAEEVARTGETFLTNEAQRDERLLEAHSVHDLRLQAIACFPLVWQGERLGVIYIENRFRKQILPPERVKLLEAFSVQAALTIVNARLDEENRRRTEELERSKLEIEELNQRLEVKVVEQSKELEVARREIERKQDQLEDRYRFHNILGASPRMQTIYQLLSRISATELPVLVEGESGTGKELVAQAIHFNSARRRAPFVSENCGALTESLFESELFGHQRGAFTGADRDREGLFALAESGTLFLDEIHELSLDSQGKLLRVLQDGVYRPVGGKQFLRADVRILSASNQPLLGQVQTGRFREDLYYRLNVLRVDLPPLRERGADVILLARHFLTQVTESEGLPRKELSQEAMRLLSRYRYPGNVRELRNLIEKAAVLSDSELIMEDDLFFDEDPRGAGSPLLPSRSALDLPLKEAREGFQRDYVEQMLLANRGVVSRAAAQAGITRESFHRLMKKHGIRRVPRKGR